MCCRESRKPISRRSGSDFFYYHGSTSTVLLSLTRNLFASSSLCRIPQITMMLSRSPLPPAPGRTCTPRGLCLTEVEAPIQPIRFQVPLVAFRGKPGSCIRAQEITRHENSPPLLLGDSLFHPLGFRHVDVCPRDTEALCRRREVEVRLFTDELHTTFRDPPPQQFLKLLLQSCSCRIIFSTMELLHFMANAVCENENAHVQEIILLRKNWLGQPEMLLQIVCKQRLTDSHGDFHAARYHLGRILVDPAVSLCTYLFYCPDSKPPRVRESPASIAQNFGALSPIESSRRPRCSAAVPDMVDPPVARYT